MKYPTLPLVKGSLTGTCALCKCTAFEGNILFVVKSLKKQPVSSYVCAKCIREKGFYYMDSDVIKHNNVETITVSSINKKGIS